MSNSQYEAGASLSLADVNRALQKAGSLSATRGRDLRSAISRVAALLGEDPGRLPLDLAIIGAKLGAINPVAAGLTPKTLSNIRSDLLAAVRASGLQPVLASKAALSPPWAGLLAKLPGKRTRIGLSRLARYASAAGLTPGAIDDAAIAKFIGDVRKGSLHHNPNVLHQKTATIWNEAANALPHLGLRLVTRPSFRNSPKRVDWSTLTEGFRADVDKYLAWCAVEDVFATDARPRSLAPRTLKLRRNQIHAAATALIDDGMAIASIISLADLVSIDHFRRILRQRHREAGEQENAFNRDLAEAMVQIAREWVKVDAAVLAELKRLSGKMPMPKAGLTTKNKSALRQFDDPAVVGRFLNLPFKLWAEVRRDPKPNFRMLAKAQAALAIAMLTYMPLRSQNLHGLIFDEHIFLRDESRSTSSLEIPADEVKNKIEVAFDIPPHIAKMLIDYRDRIVPKVIGRRPERVFVNADGTPKSQAMVALLIKTCLHRRAGITLTAHQFRHLSAKVVLDADPGAHETVRQFLGHKNLKTTVSSYAGIDSRRAGRHHQRLIESALAEAPMSRRRKKRAGKRPNQRRKNTSNKAQLTGNELPT
jgi:integrase